MLVGGSENFETCLQLSSEAIQTYVLMTSFKDILCAMANNMDPLQLQAARWTSDCLANLQQGSQLDKASHKQQAGLALTVIAAGAALCLQQVPG